MIEAIVSAALAKIAEGSGATLVDLIRRRLFKSHDSPKALEALNRLEIGDASATDERELKAVIVNYADKDPAFLGELQGALTHIGAINSVVSSNVQKLVQAQNVGDVTM
jgi:hypothetical protein